MRERMRYEENIESPDHQFAIAKAIDQMAAAIPSDHPFRGFFLSLISPRGARPQAVDQFLELRESQMMRANAIARAFRAHSRAKEFAKLSELGKSQPELLKATLDVGTLTNFSNIVGGQSLGYVSLDTQMARGTVRPSSFTLYQALHKTRAFQVVDYWSIATDTGGPPPGAAFAGFGSVSSGTLSTVAGKYSLQNINLKLLVEGRAITTALAAQNSFVDVAAQENANAALDILSSANWAAYWGNPTFHPNQFTGIANLIPAANIVDFQGWFNANASSNGWSNAQALFNLIYQWSAQITSYNQFGRITHAFMSPFTAGALQQLVSTVLNNVVTAITGHMDRPEGIIVNGDLQGMKTRFGDIQFPIDLFIVARDKPVQAVKNQDGTNQATTTAPTPPQSVTVASSGAASPGSAWTATYAATGQFTTYAVASCDQSMQESTLAFATPISGVATNGAYVLTITGPAAADAFSFRVFRSGLAPNNTSPSSNPAAFRYVGSVLASGASAVTFTDNNTKIPGGETIFLLDLDEDDMALDYRYLLPLTKVELFAANLFMPWAVAAIGAVRLKVPKFHGLINNFVPDNPTFNPLTANPNAV